jgi:hypothetical protein
MIRGSKFSLFLITATLKYQKVTSYIVIMEACLQPSLNKYWWKLVPMNLELWNM